MKKILMIGLVILLVFVVLVIRHRTKKEGTNWPVNVFKPSSQTSNLDWIQANGRNLVDSSGRQIILRGFVTITNNSDKSEVNYTLDDYKKMKAMGANYQSIRIGAGALLEQSNSYLGKLDKMVSLAKQAGIYSEFKLTTYDLRMFVGPGRKNAWMAFWKNTNGGQEKLIAGWEKLWQKYVNEPAVVGYDLLNEPEKGDLAVSDDAFISQYLTPFYQKMIDNLRKTDNKHLAFFQSPFGYPPYNTPLQRTMTVYAPHFYPNLVNFLRSSDYSAGGYGPEISRFISEASISNAPLFIGEYGMPWDSGSDGNSGLEQRYQTLEKTAASLFDQNKLGFSRPWYADDRAAANLFGFNLDWSVIKGRNGLNGSERTFITDIFARAYPQRVAGVLNNFSYNFDSNQFSLSYSPDSSKGETKIYVPRARHFSNGFTIKHSAGITLVYDPQTSSLKPTQNTGNIDANNFSWDETNQILTIKEWSKQPSVTLGIFSQ